MKNPFTIGLLVVLLAGCVPHKKVTYFNNLSGTSPGTIQVPAPPGVVLQPADLVEVNITSASMEANAYFQKSGSETDRKYAGNVYQIARDSTIDLPLIGRVKIGGLEPDSAAGKLRVALLRYLQQPSVNVRLTSFSVTILGEVEQPGVYDIPAGRVNVLEAIGYAGDLTIFGRRDNILLIRNSPEGKNYYRLNLGSSDFMDSPLFYLHNGDILYIEPSQGRTSQDDNAYRILPLILSALTFVVVVIGLTR